MTSPSLVILSRMSERSFPDIYLILDELIFILYDEQVNYILSSPHTMKTFGYKLKYWGL